MRRCGCLPNRADAAGAARLLGHGWFRHAWEVADASGAGLALKTLR